jgi:hypothetical protein
MFFASLGKVLVYEKCKFQCQDIYSEDETAITTVRKPTKVLARKGVKQVGAVTSVTMSVAVGASRNSIPPYIVFPRKNFRDYFIAN